MLHPRQGDVGDVAPLPLTKRGCSFGCFSSRCTGNSFEAGSPSRTASTIADSRCSGTEPRWLADLRLGRVRVGDQRLRGDQHAGGAVAALQAVPSRSCPAARSMSRRPRNPSDRGDAMACATRPSGRRAPARRRASPSRRRKCHAHSDVRAGQAQLVPQPVDERQARQHCAGATPLTSTALACKTLTRLRFLVRAACSTRGGTPTR